MEQPKCLHVEENAFAFPMYGERDISNHMVPEIRFDAKYKYEYVQLLNDDVLA